MKVRGNGKREKQRENGPKVSCIVTIKVSEHMYIKVETIIEDLCGRIVGEDRISVKKCLFLILPSTNTQKFEFEKQGQIKVPRCLKPDIRAGAYP